MDESSANGGLHSVFVARLDAAGDHFDLLNNGQPISHSGLDSTRPELIKAAPGCRPMVIERAWLTAAGQPFPLASVIATVA